MIHFYRYVLLSIIVSFFASYQISAQTQFLHYVPKYGIKTLEKDTTIQSEALLPITASSDTILWFAPTVGFDLFVRENGTKQYKVGLIPGVGYGLKWGSSKENSIYLSLDVFLQAAMSEEIDSISGPDYFNIDVLPIITVYDWFSIGFGWRFKLGLDQKVADVNRNLFSFGIRKSI